jgi:Tol biopolymer transport system component
MRTRRLACQVALVAMLGCGPSYLCASADAAFTPFQLVSASSGQQAEYAYQPAVSADGRYVVFTGVIGSKHGVYRKDLASGGKLATVALGTATGAPSVSADGQFVAFTTADEPSTGRPIGNGCTQVYVRDMEKDRRTPELPEGLANEPGEFQLASARDGSEEPLSYEGSGQEGCPGGGSATSARVALSADGSKVVFTAIGCSDLTTAEPVEVHCESATPPDQVAVRDLNSHTTSLISTLRGSQAPVPDGAALSETPSQEKFANGSRGIAQDAASSAAISAQGNAVAWMGIDVRAQSETSLPPPEHGADEYAEPLWRKLDPETGAPAEETRRVLAGDDPSAPGCPPNCEGGLEMHWDQQAFETYTGQGPKFGSYIDNAERGFQGGALGDVTPQLSADGSKVAVLSTQPDFGHIPNFGNLPPSKSPTANAFVVDMAPGLTRAQAITRLTEWASPNFEAGLLDGAIAHIAISPDGTRVLFATSRTAFPLAPPALITTPVSQLQPASQLYEVNLSAGTLALVSEGYDGEPANVEQGNGGIGAAAPSADGRVIALASGSSNLAPGSVNEGSGVFVTEEEDRPPVAGIQSISPLPPVSGAEESWSISATARRGPAGALLIDVAVPGAGRLTASASSMVPTAVPAKRRSAKGARGRSRSTRPTIVARRVAYSSRQAAAEGLVELRLIPASPYRALASAKAGLYATVAVAFSAPGHKTLTQTLQASFPGTRAHAPTTGRRSAKRKQKQAHRKGRG